MIVNNGLDDSVIVRKAFSDRKYQIIFHVFIAFFICRSPTWRPLLQRSLTLFTLWGHCWILVQIERSASDTRIEALRSIKKAKLQLWEGRFRVHKNQQIPLNLLRELIEGVTVEEFGHVAKGVKITMQRQAALDLLCGQRNLKQKLQFNQNNLIVESSASSNACSPKEVRVAVVAAADFFLSDDFKRLQNNFQNKENDSLFFTRNKKLNWQTRSEAYNLLRDHFQWTSMSSSSSDSSDDSY